MLSEPFKGRAFVVLENSQHIIFNVFRWKKTGPILFVIYLWRNLDSSSINEIIYHLNILRHIIKSILGCPRVLSSQYWRQTISRLSCSAGGNIIRVFNLNWLGLGCWNHLSNYFNHYVKLGYSSLQSLIFKVLRFATLLRYCLLLYCERSCKRHD